jgi:hypothetical protein
MIGDHDGGAPILAPSAPAFFLHFAQRHISRQSDQIAGVKPNSVAAPLAQRPQHPPLCDRMRQSFD